MDKVIPGHERAVGRIVSDAQGIPYRPLEGLEEAKKFDDAYVILQGDEGGRIYLSFPVKDLKCDYEILKELLRQIDLHVWGYDILDMAGIYFERKKIGEGIVGGDGGGAIVDGLWVHECIEDLKKSIFKILVGKKPLSELFLN